MQRDGRALLRRRPLVVDPAGNTGMPILYENPAEVGADRIVNAIAAYEMYGRADDRPLIVCDFGTATTLDAVSAKGEYLGGAICPGVHDFRRRALSARGAAAAHRRAEAGDASSAARRSGRWSRGCSTDTSGMVEGLVRRMSDELGGNAVCVATGGLAAVIAPETELIEHVDIDLTLHGLRIVWERNQIETAVDGCDCDPTTTAAKSKPTSVGRTTDT